MNYESRNKLSDIHQQFLKALEPQYLIENQFSKIIESRLESHKQLQKQISELYKPHQKLQKQISKKLDSRRQMQEQISKRIESQHQMYEQIAKRIESHLASQRQIHEQFAKKIETSLESQRQQEIAKILKRRQELQEQISKVLKTQRHMQEQFLKILIPRFELQEQISKAIEKRQQMQEMLTNSLEPLHRTKLDILNIKQSSAFTYTKILENINKFDNSVSFNSLADIEVLSEDTVSLDGNIINIIEVTQEFGVFTAECEITNSFQFIEQFNRWLLKLQPLLRVLAIYVFLPYIVSIIANLTTPIYEEYISVNSHCKHEVNKKEIIKEAKNLFSNDEMSQYRFITSSFLRVRYENNTSSSTIDELHNGKIVRFLKKEKRWCYIEYNDSFSGETKHGWVFSRYLAKLEK